MRNYLAGMFVLVFSCALAAQEPTNGISISAQPSVRIKAAINDGARVRLSGNTHPLVRPEFDRGLAPMDLPMQRMLMVLKRSPEQQRALDQYLASTEDKTSPNYHRWLTPGQFGEKFGAAQPDIDKINVWLRSHGLTTVGVSKGRGILEFSGSSGQVAETFHTQIHAYELNGAQHYANASDPEIPAALAPVVAGVASMHNFLSSGSANLVGTGYGSSKQGTTKPMFTFYDQSSTIGHALVPDDLQTIYSAAPLLKGGNKTSGAGQKVAIVARSNINANDFGAFRALFQPFARQDALKIIVNGTDPGFTYDADMVEATADAQYAGAMAPDADILLVVSASTNDSDGIALSATYAVDNNLAPVLSVSYGLCEQAMGTAYNQFYSALWEQAAAQGITVVVSSGDAGPAGCEQPFATGDPNLPTVSSKGAAVNGLASTPYNTAVGGTQFNESGSTSYWGAELNVAYGSVLSYIPEVAWNESCSPDACGNKSNFSASSGGPSSCTVSSTASDGTVSCSSHYPKPTWQNGPGVPNDSARDLPDLALSSAAHDGYVLCFQGSCSVNPANGNFDFYVVGGTSLAAPSFAGVVALVNQRTGTAQGQVTPVLYNMAAAQSPGGSKCDASSPDAGFESCVFRDVTQGNSDVPCAGGTPGCTEIQVGRYGTRKGYSATPGYDLVTGLGSINVANLVNNWSTGTRAGTQTSLSISPTSLIHGQQAEVVVSVYAQSGQGTPGGDIVILTTTTAPNGTAVLHGTLTNGSFTATIGSLPGGSYEVSARYAGDGEFASSIAPPVPVVIGPEASTIKLKAFLKSQDGFVPIGATVAYGSTVLLNAQAAGESGMGAPSGTMAVQVAEPSPGAQIAQRVPINNEGTAEIGAIMGSLGSYGFSAKYSGDASFAPSASDTVAWEVVKATPTVFATTARASVSANDEIQIHVVLSTSSMSGISPSGTVAVTIGTTQLQTATLRGYADATTGFAYAAADLNVPANRLSIGANSLNVVYAGDGYYNGASASTPISVGVTNPVIPPGNAVAVNLSAVTPNGGNSLTFSEVVTLKAEVSRNSRAVEGGTVTFYSGTHQLGTVRVVGPHPAPGFSTGMAMLKMRLPSGANLLTARYSGLRTTYLPAVSSTVVVDVTGSAPTQSQLAASETPGHPANYDLVLSVLGNSAIPPSGTASFHNNTSGNDVGNSTLQAAAAPLALVSAGSVAVDKQLLTDSVAVAIADLNNDGIPDAVTANRDDMSVSVLLGKGDGTFEAARQFSVDSAPVQLIITDANLDGIPDVITANANGTITVFLGKGDGTFSTGNSFGLAEPPAGMIEGDFNADGIPDLAVYSGDSPYVFVLLGNGDGSFQPAQGYLSGEVVTGLAAGDLNHDGVPDLVTSGATGLYSLTGQRDGTFKVSDTRPYDGGSNYYMAQVSSPVVADFNGDGIADIAMIPNMLPYEVIVLAGNADGGVQPATTLYPSNFNYLNTTISEAAISVADINADGIPDIVQMLAGTSNGKVISGLYVYFGRSDGSFSEPTFFTMPIWTTSAPNAIAIADLDGDGLNDVVTTLRDSASVGLTSALLKSLSTATVTDLALGASTQTVQASYTPDAGSSYAPSMSNTLTLGNLVATVSALQYGYKTNQGSCYLGGAASTVYWGSAPCFYLHVTAATTGVPAITGTVTLNGTTPGGDPFTAGPYPVYPDGSGGGYIYIFYNYGLGDAGNYSFSMSYSGDGNFQSSVSCATVSVPVRPLPTTTTLVGPSKLLAGDDAVITGQLASPIFSGVYLFGSVELYDGAVLLQENYFWSNSLLFVTPLSTTGIHNISARYKGLTGRYDTLNTGDSVSNILNVDVRDRNLQHGGTIKLSVAPDPVADGTPITLLATVTNGAFQNVSQNKGTVTFFDGGTALGTVAVTGSNAAAGHVAGTATLKQNFSAGKHPITARFDGTASLTSAGAQTIVPLTSATHDLLVATTGASDTELTAQSSASNSRAYDLTATTFAYGSAAPAGLMTFRDITANAQIASVALDATAAKPGFGPVQTLPIAGEAETVVAADFNGDGLPDLAVTDTARNAVHVLLNNGKGAYGKQADYAVSGVPVVIRVTDINRDGVPDIVVGTANKHIDLLLGNPDGTFQPPRSLTVSFVPGQILSGDLNGDGFTDLVAVGQAGSTSLAVLLGNGDGTFNTETDYTIPKLWSGGSALLADLNGDGVLDVLLVTNSYATYQMLGIGDGALQPAIYFNSANGNAIATDLNGDGIIDLAFISSPGAVGVQLGRGDGTFTPLRYYPSGAPETNPTDDGAEPSSAALPIAVADFNGDGVPDIIVPGMILLGAGDGTFRQNPVPYDGTFSTLSDVNEDGVSDLLSASQGSLQVRYGGTTVSGTLNGVELRGSGTHGIEARYGPSDGSPYATSTSQAIQLQAYQTAPSTVTLIQSSPAVGNSIYGDSIAVQATVGPANGNGHPGGNVLFTVDGAIQQSIVLPSDGSCQFVIDGLSGGTHSITAQYGGDSFFSQSTASLAVTIQTATVAVSLATSLQNANLGQSVNLTATVHGNSGTAKPSGSVTFQDGATPLATVPLSSYGVAAYLTSVLTAGPHTLTATYQGDSNFRVASSAAVVQTVVAPDFTIVANPATLNVPRGQSGVADISITSVGGYSGTVNLACANLPSETSCVFTPANLIVGGATPQTARLTVSVSAQQLAEVRRTGGHGTFGQALAALSIGLPGLICAGFGRRKKRLAIISLIAVVSATVWITGCGGGNSSSVTPSAPSSTYSVPITATTGNVGHTLQLTIIVQ